MEEWNCTVYSYISFQRARKLSLCLTAFLFILCMLMYVIFSLSYKMPFTPTHGERMLKITLWGLNVSPQVIEHFNIYAHLYIATRSLPFQSRFGLTVHGSYRGSEMIWPVRCSKWNTFTCKVEVICFLTKTCATWWLKVKWCKGRI